MKAYPNSKAYSVYLDEMENEVFKFTNFTCSPYPALQERARMLLKGIHVVTVTLEQAEERLWDLELEENAMRWDTEGRL